MTDLVQYQEGSVVSRTILKQTTGSVTVFAFDRAEGLSEHTVPYDALVHLLDGEAEITIAGIAHRVKQGDMIVLPAHEPHALHATTRFKMVLTLIKS
ncbi:MAG: cupin domain-containing protein [Rhodothermales bacterium]